MFRIRWKPYGFLVIDQLPIRDEINSTYHTTNIFHPLHQAFLRHRRDPYGNGLVLYVQNYSAHRSVTIESVMKTRDILSMPHPPHSRDPAASDFSLFSTVEERLEHASIIDEDQLFEEFHTILRSIAGEELERVFDAWRECVQNVNQGDGGNTH
jgi:hypothetical protein